MGLSEIEDIVNKLRDDFDTIAMPRPAYVLEYLVVKPHEHITQQWQQCVLEMRIKYNNIRRSQIEREIIRLEINQLDLSNSIEQLKGDLKRITLEEMEWAELGMIREFLALYEIYKQFPHFSREELDAGQTEYWYNRLVKQATQDILATGRIGQGNQEGLRQIHTEVKVNGQGQIESIQHLRLNDAGQ